MRAEILSQSPSQSLSTSPSRLRIDEAHGDKVDEDIAPSTSPSSATSAPTTPTMASPQTSVGDVDTTVRPTDREVRAHTDWEVRPHTVPRTSPLLVTRPPPPEAVHEQRPLDSILRGSTPPRRAPSAVQYGDRGSGRAGIHSSGSKPGGYGSSLSPQPARPHGAVGGQATKRAAMVEGPRDGAKVYVAELLKAERVQSRGQQ